MLNSFANCGTEDGFSPNAFQVRRPPKRGRGCATEPSRNTRHALNGTPRSNLRNGRTRQRLAAIPDSAWSSRTKRPSGHLGKATCCGHDPGVCFLGSVPGDSRYNPAGRAAQLALIYTVTLQRANGSDQQRAEIAYD